MSRGSSPVLAASKGGSPKLAERPVWKPPDAGDIPPPRPNSRPAEQTRELEQACQPDPPLNQEEEQSSPSSPAPSRNGGAASRASVPNGAGRQGGVPSRKKKVIFMSGHLKQDLHTTAVLYSLHLHTRKAPALHMMYDENMTLEFGWDTCVTRFLPREGDPARAEKRHPAGLWLLVSHRKSLLMQHQLNMSILGFRMGKKPSCRG